MAKGKFHINDSGEPGPCGAGDGRCPFGSDERDHFNTPEEAREAYEKRNEEKLIPKTSERPERLKVGKMIGSGKDTRIGDVISRGERRAVVIGNEKKGYQRELELVAIDKNGAFTSVFKVKTSDVYDGPAHPTPIPPIEHFRKVGELSKEDMVPTNAEKEKMLEAKSNLDRATNKMNGALRDLEMAEKSDAPIGKKSKIKRAREKFDKAAEERDEAKLNFNGYEAFEKFRQSEEFEGYEASGEVMSFRADTSTEKGKAYEEYREKSKKLDNLEHLVSEERRELKNLDKRLIMTKAGPIKSITRNMDYNKRLDQLNARNEELERMRVEVRRMEKEFNNFKK